MNRAVAIALVLLCMVASVVRGAEGAAMGVRGEIGPKGEPKRVKTLVIDKPGVYENYLVDAEWGDVDAVRIRADGVTLRNCEIRNGRRDGVEVYAKDVTIENCRIHHFLAGTMREQKDAHGITGRPVRLTVRNCEIGYVSGDCLQFDPGRKAWGEVVVENCRLFTGPLGEDAGGFKKGERPGENGLDTKQVAANPRSTIAVRNTVVHGWAKGGQIGNAAGLNLKNHVEVTAENCVFYDCEIALRLRGPAGAGKYGGAVVRASDCVFDDVDVAVRTEDGLEGAKVVRPGFGPGVKTRHRDVGKKAVGFEMTDERAVSPVQRAHAGAERGER